MENSDTIKTVHILIVDDDDLIISLLKAALKQYMPDATVFTAANYESTKKVLEMTEIQIALVDLHLNDEKNGADVAKLVRSTYDASIVFMTGDDSRPAIQEASAVNPEGFLSKPFDTQRLATILRNILNRKKFKSVVFVDPQVAPK